MTPRRAVHACVAAPLALAAPASLAQTAAATLETTVVTATRSERAALDVPASVDVIERSEVRDAQWRVNLSESLARVPGVVALNRQNYAQDLQISIRGFGARSTFGVRGVRLYLDGIPASQPDGQGQVSNFPLDAVDRIEVLRGPFSALYGNSSGGVISMTTRVGPSEPTAEVTAAAGGYGTWRSGLSLAGGDNAASASFDASRFSTEGYREHSQATRDVVNLRAAARTAFGQLRVSVNGLDMPDAMDPLGLTRAQVQSDPRQAAPQALLFDTRKSARQAQVGGELASDLGDGWRSTVVAWLGSREVTQFQAIPVAVQASASHPGGVIDFDRRFDGVDARVQKFLDHATLTAGVNVERLDEDRRGYENFVGSTLGVQGRLRRDERNTVTSSDAYLQLEADVAPRWQVTAGARASRVEFRSDDRFLANGNDSGRIAMSSINPVVGLVYRPALSTSWYASYGRGFETPTLNELAYRPDGSAGLNTALKPARSDNVEVGVKFVASASLSATVALFGVRTEDDIVVLTNVGGRSSFGNAAATRRRGVEASIGWRPTTSLSLQAALATLRATYSEPFAACPSAPCTQPSVQVPAGNRLPGVPAETLFIRADYRTRGLDFGAEWRAQSRLPVDDRNTDFAAGWGVVNLSVQQALAVGGWNLRAFFRIDNALDKTYVGSVIVNEGNGRFFEPAPGRSWTVGLDARY
ncbi:MAG: TonB-dependent receptor family protein [Betaproteobacteria bacterium]